MASAAVSLVAPVFLYFVIDLPRELELKLSGSKRAQHFKEHPQTSSYSNPFVIS